MIDGTGSRCDGWLLGQTDEEAGAISEESIAEDPPVGGPGHNRPIEGVLHDWPVRRRTRSFRLGILEPAAYNPATHAELFGKVVTGIIEPTQIGLDAPRASLDGIYDLLVCPEAFLPAMTLLEVLELVGTQSHFPCVHIGLRPDDKAGTHLFNYTELTALVRELQGLSKRIREDLAMFAGWLDGMSPTSFFNVACIFMVDLNGDLRIGLHPKNTPAAVEVSALPDHNVAQADFTAVVSLAPQDGGFFRVNIQPLICSDALDLQRDTHRQGPMAVLASHPERVGEGAPEHIDIVSVATCTPQKNEAMRGEPDRLTWQPKFRDMFVKILEGAELARHRNAMVVLANPRLIEKRPGGLSGCFVPLSLPEPTDFGPSMRYWSYGRPDREDNRWAPSTMSKPLGHRWSSLGHLVALDPEALAPPPEDVLIAFTIPSLLRDRVRTDHGSAISALEIQKLGTTTAPPEHPPGEA